MHLSFTTCACDVGCQKESSPAELVSFGVCNHCDEIESLFFFTRVLKQSLVSLLSRSGCSTGTSSDVFAVGSNQTPRKPEYYGIHIRQINCYYYKSDSIMI